MRNTSPETRELLLNGIKRITENMGRVAGLPEDKLPEVIVSDAGVSPTVNDPTLAKRLKKTWSSATGDASVVDIPTKSMGAEDFPFFSTDPAISSVYWTVGGPPPRTLSAKPRVVTQCRAIIHRYLRSRRSRRYERPLNLR